MLSHETRTGITRLPLLPAFIDHSGLDSDSWPQASSSTSSPFLPSSIGCYETPTIVSLEVHEPELVLEDEGLDGLDNSDWTGDKYIGPKNSEQVGMTQKEIARRRDCAKLCQNVHQHK